MIIFSHRGLGFGEEENTFQSYKKTIENGFSLELDIRKTNDNGLILSHESYFTKKGCIQKKISESNYLELCKIFPNFENVLDFFQNNRKENQYLAIHIKDISQEKIVSLILTEIKKRDLEEACFIFDLTKSLAEKSKTYNPKVRVGLSLGERKYSETIYLNSEIKNFPFFDIVWLDEWNKGLYTKDTFSSMNRIKKELYAVSPELHRLHNHPKSKNLTDIKDVWKNLAKLGVDGICTDYPNELAAFLKTK